MRHPPGLEIGPVQVSGAREAHPQHSFYPCPHDRPTGPWGSRRRLIRSSCIRFTYGPATGHPVTAVAASPGWTWCEVKVSARGHWWQAAMCSGRRHFRVSGQLPQRSGSDLGERSSCREFTNDPAQGVAAGAGRRPGVLGPEHVLGALCHRKITGGDQGDPGWPSRLHSSTQRNEVEYLSTLHTNHVALKVDNHQVVTFFWSLFFGP